MLMIGSMSDAAILVLLAGRSISSLAIRPSQHTSQQRCRHSRHVPARILVSHFVFSVRILAAQTFYALRAERHTAETTYQCKSESVEFNLRLRYDMRISVIIFCLEHYRLLEERARQKVGVDGPLVEKIKYCNFFSGS